MGPSIGAKPSVSFAPSGMPSSSAQPSSTPSNVPSDHPSAAPEYVTVGRSVVLAAPFAPALCAPAPSYSRQVLFPAMWPLVGRMGNQ
mmetsp:Transcript_21557/g.40271  ORF Transcript_21557/g.40271 Transcript_21557/m.40271 type:complete len:87 (-) Transcript_21557:153-413(-)